jgi:ElaB/YqjD/DUF883 family membrane-anchored ribosome-binding protein
MTPENEAKKLEIMRSVRQRCTDLAEKLERLHHSVIKPVEKVGEAVSSTVGTVSETVVTAHHAIESIGAKVAKWPWTSMAGSLAAGLGTGLLMGHNSEECKSGDVNSNDVATFTAPPKKPGFLENQFHKITSIAVGAGLAALRDLVKDHAPSCAHLADQFTQDLTQQLGAVNLTSPIRRPADSYCESAL